MRWLSKFTHIVRYESLKWLINYLANCELFFDREKRFVALKIVKSAPHYTETAIDEIKLLRSASVDLMLDCIVLITGLFHPHSFYIV